MTQPAELVTLEIAETQHALLVWAVVPGIRPDQLELVLDGDLLTIRGTPTRDVRPGSTFASENIAEEPVVRCLRLPISVTTRGAEALAQDGILTLILPKVEVYD